MLLTKKTLIFHERKIKTWLNLNESKIIKKRDPPIKINRSEIKKGGKNKRKSNNKKNFPVLFPIKKFIDSLRYKNTRFPYKITMRKTIHFTIDWKVCSAEVGRDPDLDIESLINMAEMLYRFNISSSLVFDHPFNC